MTEEKKEKEGGGFFSKLFGKKEPEHFSSGRDHTLVRLFRLSLHCRITEICFLLKQSSSKHFQCTVS